MAAGKGCRRVATQSIGESIEIQEIINFMSCRLIGIYNPLLIYL